MTIRLRQTDLDPHIDKYLPADKTLESVLDLLQSDNLVHLHVLLKHPQQVVNRLMMKISMWEDAIAKHEESRKRACMRAEEMELEVG